MRDWFRRPSVLIVVLCVGGLAAFVLWQPSRSTAARPLNVILVLVDTLRADHLGAYGYGRDTSPNFDAFAAGSLLFENARSQSACTFPSVNSLLTSRYPLAFLGQPEGRIGIPPEIPSLPEILGREGYRTASVSASPVVRKSPSRFNPAGGFERGFDLFDEGCLSSTAECVNRRASELLDELSEAEPFFLYLHYYDPHAPYQPPDSYRRRFASDSRGRPRFVRRGRTDPIAKRLYERRVAPRLAEDDLRHLLALYDDEIAYFDEQFGRLLAELSARGLEERTIVIVLSDHGEAFLEHQHINHCRSLYDTQIKVPLAIRIPPARSGVRLSASVENIDVVPTLMDYLGLPYRELGFQGDSLRPIIESRGRPVAARGGLGYGFGLQGDLRAVNDSRFKLLYDLESQALELFDLELDPGERTDVVAQRPEALRRLHANLTRWLIANEGAVGAERSTELTGEASERLRALGYLH